MKKLVKLSLLAAICLLFAVKGFSQQTPEKFIKEIDYLLYLPEGYGNDTAKKWPLMLFLHGAGESGTDLNKVKVHGPPKLIAEGKQFPFIVVSPQAQRGWRPVELFDLLNSVIKAQRVDEDRIYLTGLSMGGFGTWETATEGYGMFAAIAPICGGGDTAKAWKLRNMPIWCFHGAKDNVVPIQYSDKMVAAVKKYNPTVKYTIYPEADHDSWTETYNNPELYEWFLSHKRFQYTEKEIDPALFNDYAGNYLLNKSDTLRVYVKDNKLWAKPGKQNDIHLKAINNNSFFFNKDDQTDLTFIRNEKGEITEIVLTGWNKEIFPKVK